MRTCASEYSLASWCIDGPRLARTGGATRHPRAQIVRTVSKAVSLEEEGGGGRGSDACII